MDVRSSGIDRVTTCNANASVQRNGAGVPHDIIIGTTSHEIQATTSRRRREHAPRASRGSCRAMHMTVVSHLGSSAATSLHDAGRPTRTVRTSDPLRTHDDDPLRAEPRPAPTEAGAAGGSDVRPTRRSGVGATNPTLEGEVSRRLRALRPTGLRCKELRPLHAHEEPVEPPTVLEGTIAQGRFLHEPAPLVCADR